MKSTPELTAAEWIVILLIAGLVAYLPAVGGVFTFDDYPWILHNRGLDLLSFDFSLRRPVTLLTFAANLQAGGPDPVGFHVANIALHLANGVLVYLLVARSLPRTANAAALAAFGAALFVLHPAQTGAVAYVSGRATSLMTFWVLVAHLSALRALETRARGWTVLSIAAFALAVGSKETALAWPAMWVGWLVFGQGLGFARSVRLAAPSLAAAVLMCGAMLLHPGYRNLIDEAAAAGQLATSAAGRIEQGLGLGLCFNQDRPREDSCLARRAESIAGLARYLVAPREISIDPGRRALGPLDALAVMIAAVAAFAALRTRPGPIAGGAAWAIAALLPTSLIMVRPDPVADRLLYLPMAGIALVAAGLAGRVAGLAAHRVGAAGAATLVLALALLTWERNGLYGSDIALWEDAVSKNPAHARARVNLGHAYESVGLVERARVQYRAALQLRPGLPWALAGLERTDGGM